MTATLVLALCAAGQPAPGSSTVEFERALDAAIPNLKSARYVTTANRKAAAVVYWAGPEANPPVLVLFRPDGNPRLTPVRLGEAAAKVLRAATPPAALDPLLDEPADTPLGAWLKDTLDALVAVTPDPAAAAELHLAADATGKRTVVVATDAGRRKGWFLTAAVPVAPFEVQDGCFEQFFAAAPGFTRPPTDGTFVFGRRGLLVRTDAALHLRLDAPWDQLPLVGRAEGRYRTITPAEFAASQRGPFADLLPARPSPDALVVTAPPSRVDPLVGLLAAP